MMAADTNQLCKRVYLGHVGAINCIRVTADGKHAISGGEDGFIRFWDLTSDNPMCVRVLGHGAEKAGDAITSLAVSADQKRVEVVHLGEYGVRWWLGDVTPDASRYPWPVYDVAVLSDDRSLVAGSYDRIGRLQFVMRLWGGPSTKFGYRTADDHRGPIRAIVATPDGLHAISAGGVQLRRWRVDLKKGSIAADKDYRGHAGVVQSVAVSRDGKLVVSGASDRTARLWDLKSGKCLKVLEGHTDRINSVAFLPDPPRAVSGSGDGTIRLWDLETGRELQALTGHEGKVYAVAVTPDGHRLLSGGTDEKLRLWDLDALLAGKRVK